MGEKTDREPIAIAMYESWARRSSERDRMFQHDWYSLEPNVRKKWRARVDEMIDEAIREDWRD